MDDNKDVIITAYREDEGTDSDQDIVTYDTIPEDPTRDDITPEVIIPENITPDDNMTDMTDNMTNSMDLEHGDSDDYIMMYQAETNDDTMNDTDSTDSTSLENIIRREISEILNGSLDDGRRFFSMNEVVEELSGVWEGLEIVTKPKLRYICFIDRLNRFHNFLWKQLGKNSSESYDGYYLESLQSKLEMELSNIIDLIDK